MSGYTEKELSAIAPEMNKTLQYFVTKTNIAIALSVSPQLVGQWFDRGWIPLNYVYKLSTISKDFIKCHKLAPGKFPKSA